MNFLKFHLIALVLLISCNPDKNKVVDRNSPNFETNDATRLFFKNVRQLYYDVEDKKEEKIQILRIGTREVDSAEAYINVCIINNWMQDRAYPMIDLSKYFNDYEVLKIDFRKDNKSIETILFDRNSTMNDHYYFACALYEAILKSYEIVFVQKNEILFQDKEQRDSFRITMVDFFRLVKVY